MKQLFMKGLIVIFLTGVGTNTFAQVTVKESSFQGLKAIVLESESLKLRILPERGANIISIYDKAAKREWVWQNPVFKYKKPKYGDAFSAYDMSGFDDSFPNLAEEKCFTDPWKDILMPDHGEVWSLPWNYRIEKKRVLLSVHGIRFPYILEKEIRLDEKIPVITLCYKVTNLSPMKMPILWCGHYIVAIRPGMQAFFPRDIEFMSDPGQWSPERRDDLAWIKYGSCETEAVTKFFTKKLSEGFTGFYDPLTKDFFLYSFSTRDLPYVGIWINQCGYPSPGAKFYHAGLEPTNGLETQADTQKAGLLNYLKANGSIEWKIKIILGKSERKKLYKEIIDLRREHGPEFRK